MKRAQRGAFTLVELLVVIGIIGILAGLVLPAVHAALQRAYQVRCEANLVGLAQATLLHESRKQRFPGFQEIVGKNRATWTVALLPDIDHQPLYDRWYAHPAGKPPTGEMVPYLGLLRCPAAGRRGATVTENSYVANVGFGPRLTGINAPSSDPQPFLSGAEKKPGYYWRARRKANGVFADRVLPGGSSVAERAFTVSRSDLADGSSNTILFSERLEAGDWDQLQPATAGVESFCPPTGMLWLYVNEPGAPLDPSVATSLPIAPTTTLADHMRINGARRSEPRLVRGASACSDIEWYRPSSWHPGGVVVAFSDGRVQYLSERMAYHVYQQLLTANGLKSDMPYRTYY